MYFKNLTCRLLQALGNEDQLKEAKEIMKRALVWYDARMGRAYLQYDAPEANVWDDIKEFLND